MINNFSGYAVVLPTQPAGRNPCVAVSELAAEYERFINSFLTNDDVCPAKRRSAVSKILIKTKLLSRPEMIDTVYLP